MPPHSNKLDNICGQNPGEGESTEFSTPRKQEKSVSFCRSVLAYPYLHINDFSDHEVYMAWYNEEDLDLIKEECRYTLKMMRLGKCPEDDPNFCTRGLECRTKIGAQLRSEHKFEAWDAVEDEQNRQWEQGVLKPDEIAKVYHDCTNESQREAHLLALNDEHIAHEDHEYYSFKTCSIECSSDACNISRKEYEAVPRYNHCMVVGSDHAKAFLPGNVSHPFESNLNLRTQ